MNLFIALFMTFGAIYFFGFAVFMNTKNFISALLFQAIPGAYGIVAGFIAFNYFFGG